MDLEDEYMAQQEEKSDENDEGNDAEDDTKESGDTENDSSYVEGNNSEKENEKDASAGDAQKNAEDNALNSLVGSLALLNENLASLYDISENLRSMAETVANYEKACRELSALAGDLPPKLERDFVEAMKDTFHLAAENFKRLHADEDKWQRGLMKKRAGDFENILILAYLSPVLSAAIILILLFWR